MSYWVIVVMMLFLVTSFLTTRFVFGGVPALFTKTLASVGFMFAAILGVIYTSFFKFHAFLILGLLFGLIGDILLDLKRLYKQDSAVYLNYGMLVFGLGHIMYFMMLGNYYGFEGDFIVKSFISLGIAVVVSAAIVFGGAKLLKLNFGEFKWQSFAYSIVLVFVAVLSLFMSLKNDAMWFVTAGLIAFFASDLVLSTQYFGGREENKLLTTINHILYYGAQVLIAGQIFY